MEKTKIDALRAFAHDVRFQFYARESIADALELIATELEAKPQVEGAEQVAALSERLQKLEALLDQLKPPVEPVAQAVAEPVQAGTDTNVGA